MNEIKVFYHSGSCEVASLCNKTSPTAWVDKNKLVFEVKISLIIHCHINKTHKICICIEFKKIGFKKRVEVTQISFLDHEDQMQVLSVFQLCSQKTGFISDVQSLTHILQLVTRKWTGLKHFINNCQVQSVNLWFVIFRDMSASLLRKVSYNVRRFTDDSLDVSDISHLLSSFQVHQSNVFYDPFKHRNQRNQIIAFKS